MGPKGVPDTKTYWLTDWLTVSRKVTSTSTAVAFKRVNGHYAWFGSVGNRSRICAWRPDILTVAFRGTLEYSTIAPLKILHNSSPEVTQSHSVIYKLCNRKQLFNNSGLDQYQYPLSTGIQSQMTGLTISVAFLRFFTWMSVGTVSSTYFYKQRAFINSLPDRLSRSSSNVKQQ
jgi:hypothetical protein